MSTQTEWKPFTGNESDFAGLASVPQGEYGVDERQGLWLYRMPQTNALMVRPVQPGEIVGVGSTGLGAASVGDAVSITAAQADTACTGTDGATHDGFIGDQIPPSDVAQLLNPNTISAGNWTGGDVYAQYKTGASAEIWRFSNPEGYAKCSQVSPTGQPVSGPGITGVLSNMTPTTKTLAIGGAILLGVGGAAWLYHRSKKRRR